MSSRCRLRRRFYKYGRAAAILPFSGDNLLFVKGSSLAQAGKQAKCRYNVMPATVAPVKAHIARQPHKKPKSANDSLTPHRLMSVDSNVATIQTEFFPLSSSLFPLPASLSQQHNKSRKTILFIAEEKIVQKAPFLPRGKGRPFVYSTVTDFARFLGLSTSFPL
jgi:hypothetical protein